MRMAIRYLTTFTYDTHVSESQNALRAKPVSDGRQRLIDYSVTVDPAARIFSYTDYWGTQVDCFGVIGRHTRLTVVADSMVETSDAREPVEDGAWPPRVGWTTREAEYLTTTPHVEWTDEIAEFAEVVTAGAGSTVAAAQAVQAGVGERLSYVSGSTDIGVTVAEVFAQRTGVCQDYAHLALAVYRSLGIPARYVSGYLYAADAAAGVRPDDAEVDVSTHAWVEVLVPGYGWWGLDPTNQKVVGEQHVKIGHGRDYEDVMPLRGVYHGDAESGGLTAGVKMSRASLDPYAMQPRPVYVRRQEQQQQQ
jgi:transglutaminase-like putative cysteine protease